MNLVGNNTLGRIVVLSIWQCYCITKSAASAYASMNTLIRRLPNWYEYHSYPTKGIHYWNFWGYLGQAICKPDEPKSTDKYPSLNISGYIYSVKGEPLTGSFWRRIDRFCCCNRSNNESDTDWVDKCKEMRNCDGRRSVVFQGRRRNQRRWYQRDRKIFELKRYYIAEGEEFEAELEEANMKEVEKQQPPSMDEVEPEAVAAAWMG